MGREIRYLSYNHWRNLGVRGGGNNDPPVFFLHKNIFFFFLDTDLKSGK